jgi:error-prone DNA polymerase
MNYAPYFLTVYSIVRFARSQRHPVPGARIGGELGRLLRPGHHLIDPEPNDLLFERFVSAGADEPPDIDVDFEHAGAKRSSSGSTRPMAGEGGPLRDRHPLPREGRARDVGKALGLPEDVIKALSSGMWSLERRRLAKSNVNELNLNPDDRRLRLTLQAGTTADGRAETSGPASRRLCLTQ